MTDTTVTTEAPQPSTSSLHQPARDNAGNTLPPLQTHTQRPDPAPPARRGVIADSVYDGLPPDQQSRYAMMQKPGDQGGSEWVARDQVAKDSGITADPAAAGDKVKVGEFELTPEEVAEFFKAKADTELRKTSLPITPADYKAELPANFELPAGVTEFKFDETDPLLADARNWAHAKGLDQATFSEMVGMYASSKATEQAQFNAAHATEVAKMGANGAQRVTALEIWLRGMVGDKLAGPMRCMMVTADIVKGLETMQRKFSTQGASGPMGGRQAPEHEGAGPSEERWGQMSAAERMDYTNNTDQSRFRAGR